MDRFDPTGLKEAVHDALLKRFRNLNYLAKVSFRNDGSIVKICAMDRTSLSL